MNSDTLQKAIDSLHIKDVYLREHTAKCFDGFDPKYDSNIENLSIEQLHFVKESQVGELSEDEQLLRVFVQLGVRWVSQGAEELEEGNVQAQIEAEFIAEYDILEPLEQKCIDEFCLNNASFHVWPYWRELLSTTCTRMSLPKLVLPTVQFAKNRSRQADEDY